jgi:predicted DsbA family dithiol-disulfide isomerase
MPSRSTMVIPSPPQSTTATSVEKKLQIDVWSDLACPFCYIGKNRLDRAIASSPYAEVTWVRVRSYELDPGMSDEAKPNLELVAAKYGVSSAEARRMDDNVAAIAQRDGLPFSADRVAANSFDVHRVLHLAGIVGLDDQLLGALQRTMFSGQDNIYDHAVLTEAAGQLGISPRRVKEVLASDEYADDVRDEEAEARRLGVTAIPFTVFDGRIAISGAASIEDFAKAIQQAWSNR